ncbi:AAA family ATPase [Streptomyces klenkii]|uniref:AAA family ATPase n=1 Tax=Streptomyces klenkii TaxID=1420899 RepID=UPI0033A657BE
MKEPIAVLLVGLPCSGKTTLADQLTPMGLTHLSVDRTMYNLYGRADINYPMSDYQKLRRTASKPSGIR